MPLLFFLSGRCGVARQAALPEDNRDRRGYRLCRQRSLRRHGTPYAAGGHILGGFELRMAVGSRKKEEERCEARSEHRHRHRQRRQRRGRYCGSRRRYQPRRCRRQRRDAKRRDGDRADHGACDQGERKIAPRSGGRGRRIPVESGAPLEREVSRLREKEERLTKERAERTAKGPHSESEGQKGGSHLRGGRKKKPSGTQRERL